jgi:molybdopterin converting factor subunit 1
VQLTVLLFASYAEALGTARLELTVPEQTAVGELVERLRAVAGPGTLPPRPLVAVNRRYAAYDHPLSATDEVAVIPPVAGG